VPFSLSLAFPVTYHGLYDSCLDVFQCPRWINFFLSLQNFHHAHLPCVGEVWAYGIASYYCCWRMVDRLCGSPRCSRTSCWPFCWCAESLWTAQETASSIIWLRTSPDFKTPAYIRLHFYLLLFSTYLSRLSWRLVLMCDRQSRPSNRNACN